MTTAVLFARRDSIYKTLPDCDVWDIDRNALNWPGGNPVIAHPPCRAWGQLRHFARPRAGERELAIWAVDQVRQWGGVLEHPAKSTLWPTLGLPKPGQRDEYGGFSLWISQWWFGHRADKSTLLYIVGCEPADLPPIPFQLGEPTHVIAQHRTKQDGTRLTKGKRGWKPETTKAERERTPLALAEWLRAVALRVAEAGQRGGRKTQEALARLHSVGSLNRSHDFTAGGRGSSLAPLGRRSFTEDWEWRE